MKREIWQVDGRSMTVWSGGAGETLLLIHGGWAGAEAHWASVWDRLADSYHVVAPELPGVAADFDAALPSIDALADLMARVIGAAGPKPAIVIGNSLGGSIGWALACRHPDAVARLVVVDGFPRQPLPAILRWLFGSRWIAARAKASMVKGFYSPAILDKAFFDAGHVPDAVRANLTRPPAGMVEAMFRLVVAVDRQDGTPAVPVDFLWGGDDRLDSVTRDVAEALQRKTPASRLVFVERAGHLPQWDNPEGFLAGLASLLAAPAD